MPRTTPLAAVCGIAAALFSVAAVLGFLDGAVLTGALQTLGAALFVASGVLAHTAHRSRCPA
ncbi:hypothetical protein Q7C18_01430 [Nesterenkonia sp. CL21]|uniref:hypothetical protein n=1 Tax=Nesterenkonia sp. CL21 TaxID=3064894 RepID=UPI002878C0A8|nr:hypothetical protein [Nesterenkonia sp. CL21]MDS2171358.1 hypothetical protein [Nesterenkonia sp. CL21]